MNSFQIHFFEDPLSETGHLIGFLQLEGSKAKVAWESSVDTAILDRVKRVRQGFRARIKELATSDRPITATDFIRDIGLSVRLAPVSVPAVKS